jgi:multidrug resistance efflux pump
MSGAQTPQEVLDAVRRLEADLATIRRRARERERDLDDLRAAIAADAARERQELVEDMERLVELIGASWSATNAQLNALSSQVDGLRHFAEETAGQFRAARLEMRFDPQPANGVAAAG